MNVTNTRTHTHKHACNFFSEEQGQREDINKVEHTINEAWTFKLQGKCDYGATLIRLQMNIH